MPTPLLNLPMIAKFVREYEFRFSWLLPARQIATMSSRCESVMSVLSVHLAREVLWDAML